MIRMYVKQSNDTSDDFSVAGGKLQPWIKQLRAAKEHYMKTDAQMSFGPWLAEEYGVILIHGDSGFGIEGIEFADEAMYTMFILKYGSK